MSDSSQTLLKIRVQFMNLHAITCNQIVAKFHSGADICVQFSRLLIPADRVQQGNRLQA